MPEPKKPDLKTFLEDPAFQGDRDLLDGYIDHKLQREAAAVAQRREKKEKPAGIFDALFGYRGPDENSESENVFDSAFGFFSRKK